MAASDQRDEVIIKLKARIRELEAENAVLKNRLDKYDIPDAEVDKALAAVPDLKIKAAEHPDPEVRDALLKIDLAIEAFAANLKITRQENAALREALGAALAELQSPEPPFMSLYTKIMNARILIEKALKGVRRMGEEKKECPLRVKTEARLLGDHNEASETLPIFMPCIGERCEWWEFITGTCAVRTQAYLTAFDRPRER